MTSSKLELTDIKKRDRGWVWVMCLTPVLFGVAFAAFDWAVVPKAEPVPAAARELTPSVHSTPISVSRSNTLPPPGGRIVKVAPAPTASNAEPPPALGPFEALTDRWQKERADKVWTEGLKKDIVGAIVYADFKPDVLREIDCRQSLCRFVIEANGVAGINIRAKILREGMKVSYTQEEGTDEIVAIADRSEQASSEPEFQPTPQESALR